MRPVWLVKLCVQNFRIMSQTLTEPSEPPEAKPIDAGTVARNGDRTAAGYWDGDDMVAAAAGIAPPHDPPSADDDTAEDPIGEAKRK